MIPGLFSPALADISPPLPPVRGGVPADLPPFEAPAPSWPLPVAAIVVLALGIGLLLRARRRRRS
jgi:hypothetical protein